MKLSEFYTSITSGRTDEEYFLSKNDFSVVSSSFLQLNYQTSNTFMLSAGVYFDCTQTPLSNITFTFDKSMNNSMCLFKTDSTITFNFSYPQNGGIYINEPFNLDSDSIYLISMENNVITWTDLIDAANPLN